MAIVLDSLQSGPQKVSVKGFCINLCVCCLGNRITCFNVVCYTEGVCMHGFCCLYMCCTDSVHPWPIVAFLEFVHMAKYRQVQLLPMICTWGVCCFLDRSIFHVGSCLDVDLLGAHFCLITTRNATMGSSSCMLVRVSSPSQIFAGKCWHQKKNSCSCRGYSF